MGAGNGRRADPPEVTADINMMKTLLLTCARSRRGVQGGPEVVFLTDAHHGALLLRHAVGRTGETLLLPGGHLVGPRRTRCDGGQGKEKQSFR